VVTLAFFRKSRDLVLTWKSGLKVPFAVFIALLPSATIAGWSGWVWQPSAGSNGPFAHFLNLSTPNSNYFLQQATTPNPGSSNFIKRGLLPLPSAAGGETLWSYNMAFICDEYEMVNIPVPTVHSYLRTVITWAGIIMSYLVLAPGMPGLPHVDLECQS